MRNILVIGAGYTISAAALLALCGCGTQATRPPIVEVQHDVITPEDSLLVDCDVSAPPAKADFMASSPVAATASDVTKLEVALTDAQSRQRMLTDYARKQTDNLALCNKRLQQLRAWKVQIKDQINTVPNKKE